MRNFKHVTFILATAALLAACKSSVPLNPAPVVERAPEKPAAQPVADTRDVKPVVTEAVDPLNDPKGVLAQRSIYFDYDSYVVRDDGKPVVENHSAYLNKNKARKILIQGNTDERGGSEYNLALGQKRAEAVRRALALLGVPDSQMEAVSFGKEKPAVDAMNEDAYAQNRRAELVYR